MRKKYLAMVVKTMEKSVINYNNVYTSFYSKDLVGCAKEVKEHTLVHVDAGLLKIKYKGQWQEVKAGESVFIRRSHDVEMLKDPNNDENGFRAIFFLLDRKFLSSRYKKYKNIDCPIEKEPVVRIQNHPVLMAFFKVFTSYSESGMRPSDEVIDAKKDEALDILLKIKPSLVKSLFDFAKPWKIDLEEFMNKHFASDMNLNDFAHYTGRSLSTFKREFQEQFNESPHQWIKNKRLDEAYKMINQYNLRPSEVYMDVGFKTFSHFSSSFKDRFGVAPTAV